MFIGFSSSAVRFPQQVASFASTSKEVTPVAAEKTPTTPIVQKGRGGAMIAMRPNDAHVTAGGGKKTTR
jgi:hypothetical protein